ncbi:MAG: hypothetical protein ACLQOZ_09990 [Acidimicrobiales bacterium]|jgi:hypothetical protein
MPGSDPDAADDGTPPKPSTWRRLTSNPDNEPLSSRLKDAMLKPVVAAEVGPDAKPAPPEPTTVEELEQAVARADDKERLVGLIMAPLAAGIGLLVTGSLINNDPKALLANGAVNLKHVNPSLYLEFGGISFALALVMLGMAWYRKRLYLGIAMALYGLSIFNLHFWGFGIPFILAGAWYLVRAYRLQQKLKVAKAGGGGSGAGQPGTGRPNKRYTPPTGR